MVYCVVKVVPYRNTEKRRQRSYSVVERGYDAAGGRFERLRTVDRPATVWGDVRFIGHNARARVIRLHVSADRCNNTRPPHKSSTLNRGIKTTKKHDNVPKFPVSRRQIILAYLTLRQWHVRLYNLTSGTPQYTPVLTCMCTVWNR